MKLLESRFFQNDEELLISPSYTMFCFCVCYLVFVTKNLFWYFNIWYRQPIWFHDKLVEHIFQKCYVLPIMIFFIVEKRNLSSEITTRLPFARSFQKHWKRFPENLRMNDFGDTMFIRYLWLNFDIKNKFSIG